MNKVYDWARAKVQSPYATVIFGLLNFIEAFFLMPVNTILVIFGLERPRRVFFYAGLALGASILGSLFAYSLGALACHFGVAHVLNWFISPDRLQEFAQAYRQHEALAVFTAAVLPVPLKVITLTAGFFKLPMLTFIVSIAAARFVRFFGLATALYLWGDKVRDIIERHFYFFAALVVAVIALILWFLHR